MRAAGVGWLAGYRLPCRLHRCLDRPFRRTAFGKALLELPDQLLKILRQGLFKDVGPNPFQIERDRQLKAAAHASRTLSQSGKAFLIHSSGTRSSCLWFQLGR